MYRDVDIQGMETGEYFIYHNGTLEHTLLSTSIHLYTHTYVSPRAAVPAISGSFARRHLFAWFAAGYNLYRVYTLLHMHRYNHNNV